MSFIINLSKKDATVYYLFSLFWEDRSISYEQMLERIIIHLSEKINSLENTGS